MMRRLAVVLSLTVVASLALSLSAAQKQEEPPNKAQDPTKEDPKSDAPTQTAEEMLRKLQETEPGSEKAPPSAAASDGQKAPSTAEELLKAMQEQKPAPRVVRPWSLENGSGDGGRPQQLLPEGERISRRPGRLIREGDWWTFAFESDHPDHPEPRLNALPNLMLESMVRTIESSATGVVWVVSGEVTEYRNQNYVLIRDAQRRADEGNLRR